MMKNNMLSRRIFIKLKPELNHGLVLQKVHRAIKFSQKTWLKQ